MRIHSVGLSMVLFAVGASAAPVFDFGDASDGDLIVSMPLTVNALTELTATATAGAASLAVNDTTDFATGEEILIHTLYDSGGAGGTFEFQVIDSVPDMNTLELAGTLANTYAVVAGSHQQIISVPHFGDVTVQSGGVLQAKDVGEPTFVPDSGGVLAFRASGTLTVEPGGLINLTGKASGQEILGGGAGGATGRQGASALGPGVLSTNANEGGGGGGGGGGFGSDAGGGGGAGFATPGMAGETMGAVGGEGGSTYGDEMFTRLHMGSAGGGGGANFIAGARGGDGGGAVLIHARNVVIAGAVEANGRNGAAFGGNQNGGGGGGGSGGAIHFIVDTMTVDSLGVISAVGGAGGIVADLNGSGGDGGDGRIRIDPLTSFVNNGSVTPSATLPVELSVFAVD